MDAEKIKPLWDAAKRPGAEYETVEAFLDAFDAIVRDVDTRIADGTATQDEADQFEFYVQNRLSMGSVSVTGL